MPSNALTVATRFPPRDIKAIDALIAAGHYTNRADFLRQAARERLTQTREKRKLELEPLPPAIVELQKEIREEGKPWATEEEKWALLKKVRHEVYREEYGEDP